MARKSYTVEFKAEVVEHAVSEGLDKTYERWPTVLPGTIRQWCFRAGVVTSDSQRTQAARDALALKWLQRSGDMADRIGDAAEKALGLCVDALDLRVPDEAKNAALTMAILIDKAQLLSGGQTARIGTDEERDAVVSEARERALRLVN